MTIAHNHFYYGHGMSIGSETNGGASAIRVTDLSIDGADNGIRIKSNSARGGLVRDISYEDVCIRGTKNPILMDTHYSGNGYTESGRTDSGFSRYRAPKRADTGAGEDHPGWVRPGSPLGADVRCRYFESGGIHPDRRLLTRM